MAGKTPAALAKEKEKELRAKAKAEEEKRKKEEADLFKPVQVAQKVPFGVGAYGLHVRLQSVLDEAGQIRRRYYVRTTRLGLATRGTNASLAMISTLEERSRRRICIAILEKRS